MSLGYREVIASLNTSATALTAAARASATQGGNSTNARWTLRAGSCRLGDTFMITAGGRVSCAVTTPGTFRLDLSFGGTANFDTLAMPLNIVAQTTVPWSMIAWGSVQSVGATSTIFWQGQVSSTAMLNTAAVATGPWTGTITVPYNTAPVIGASFDNTADLAVDLQFTQTVATGSFQLHTFFCERIGTGY